MCVFFPWVVVAIFKMVRQRNCSWVLVQAFKMVWEDPDGFPRHPIVLSNKNKWKKKQLQVHPSNFFNSFFWCFSFFFLSPCNNKNLSSSLTNKKFSEKTSQVFCTCCVAHCMVPRIHWITWCQMPHFSWQQRRGVKPYAVLPWYCWRQGMCQCATCFCPPCEKLPWVSSIAIVLYLLWFMCDLRYP